MKSIKFLSMVSVLTLTSLTASMGQARAEALLDASSAAPACASTPTPKSYLVRSDTLLDCAERFHTDRESHYCRDFGSRAKCIDGALALLDRDDSATPKEVLQHSSPPKNTAQGAFIYTKKAAYHVDFPVRSQAYQKLEENCLASNKFDRNFCAALKTAPRYFKISVAVESNPKQTVILKYDGININVLTFHEGVLRRMYNADRSPLIVEDLGTPPEVWNKQSHDLILGDITQAISNRFSHNERLRFRQITVSSKSKIDPGFYPQDFEILQRCRTLYRSGSTEDLLLDRASLEFVKTSEMIQKMNQEH